MTQGLQTVEKMERAPVEAETRNQDPMVSMLERVLMDPNVPVERLERLLELQDRERQRQAKVVWAEKMSEVQAAIQAVFKNQNNTATKSRYATYDALDRMVRPLYTQQGFSVTFNTERGSSPDEIVVVAYVENCGFERRYDVPMPCDGKGAKGGDVMTRTHAVKSAITYGKSALLPMIFNIAVTDRADDDGNGASPRRQQQDTIGADQVGKLREALTFRDIAEGRACKRFKVERLEDIYAVDFDACMKIAQQGRQS